MFTGNNSGLGTSVWAWFDMQFLHGVHWGRMWNAIFQIRY